MNLRHYRDIRDATVYVPQEKLRRQGRPIPTIYKGKKPLWYRIQ
jgi:hypothetical protein